ncbi:MAG: haloacid dehalogenase-like hydrolase [Pseudobdellovibrio sp.]
MNYKSFPIEYWAEIEKTISDLKSNNEDLFAAFDADGTLWDIDLGENFFQYQIDHKKVPLPADPWTHYLEMKKINNDPRDAYAWLAQINRGLSESEVLKWAANAFSEVAPNPIFSEQKKLITLLLKNSVKIYIVTASPKLAVVPGAIAMGLSAENVIGVETEVVNGIITDNKIEPITYRQGKVDALLKKTGNVKPFLCSGNTIGDYELLNNSTHIKLAVSAASRDDKLFKSENELLTKAIENNWWRHRFI